MTPLTEARSLNTQLGHSPKLISIEISNSQGKRYGEGDREALIVHAAWTSDIEPLAIGKGTAESPQIKTDRGDLIWFGEKPAKGKHQSIATSFSDKSEMARHLIMPLLLPSDNGDVRLVISHHSIHDPVIEARLKTQLLGRHHFIRNDREVDVNVVDVRLVHEGIGAYWLASDIGQLKRGDALVVEIGYRTTESWIVDSEGNPERGEPIQMGVFDLATSISNDPTIRAALINDRHSAERVTDTQIAIALKHDHLAKIDPAQWQKVKAKHLAQWQEKVIGTVFSRNEGYLSQVEQILFSGGGSMLLRDQLRTLDFWVDESAHTASVRGSLLHHLKTYV
jgi:hypothetical protein